MASGYQYHLPRFIQPIAERIVWQAPERFAVARNYSIDRNGGEVFVQNAGLADHGLVTPDLGMGCYRNACILREICGREHYAVEEDRLPAVQPAAAAHAPGRGGGAMTLRRALIGMTLLAVLGDSLLMPFYPQYFAERFGELRSRVGLYLAAVCWWRCSHCPCGCALHAMLTRCGC